jgi:hypothetical protein
MAKADTKTGSALKKKTEIKGASAAKKRVPRRITADREGTNTIGGVPLF